MAELMFPNIAGAVLAGYQQGQERKFNALAGQAISSPENRNALLGQAAQINPGAALDIQNSLQQQDLNQQKVNLAQQDAQHKTLVNMARYLLSAPEQYREGIYQKIKPGLAQMGMQQIPDNYSPEVGQMAQSLINAWSPPEGVVVAPGGALVDKATGHQMYQAAPKVPNQIEELQYLQSHPDLAQFDIQRRLASRPVTNVSMGPQENAFQKAVGEKDATTYNKWRDEAIAASNTLKQADAVEDILNKQQTGRMQEAMAKAGQYFGTEAGSNLQALKGVIQPLVLANVKQLGTGSGISDADRNFIEAGMPGFGNDPRANAIVLKVMRAGAQRKIDLYKQADAYVTKNRSLGGFESPLVTPQNDAPTGGYSSLWGD